MLFKKLMIYIVYEHEIAEDNICMEIDEYENIYQ